MKETKIKQEINDYCENIDQYRRALQTESVWLFLATLGCWSVSDAAIQLFAFFITIVFVGIRVSSKLTVKKTFNTFERTIKELIESEFISGPRKEHYEEELQLIQQKRASNIQPLQTAPMFFICSIFLMWSIYDQASINFLG